MVKNSECWACNQAGLFRNFIFICFYLLTTVNGNTGGSMTVTHWTHSPAVLGSRPALAEN